MKTIKISNISLYLVLFGIWILFFHEILMSFCIIEMKLAYSGYFILFIALLIELKNRSLSFLKINYQLWVVSIWLFACFALLHGIAKSNSLQFLSRDIWPYSYFACFLLASRTERWRNIDKMIYQQFIIGLGIFIYIWLTTDIPFEREAISRNTISWDAPRIYWAWGLLFGWQYMFLSLKKEHTRSRKILTFLGMSLYIIFGIIMLKRQVIVELMLISFFKLLYENKIKKRDIVKWATIFVTISIMMFSVIKFYEGRENISYIEKIVSRSTEKGSALNTMLSSTRLHETPLNIYNQATFFELLYGQGLGSSVERDAQIVNVVENGILTIFLKGGLIYVIIWYFGFVLIIMETVFLTRGKKLLFGLLSAMVILGSPLAPFFIMFPSSAYQMFWFGRISSRLRDS